MFLYRPRETWMPFVSPRGRSDQAAYNRGLQERFESTRRVAPVVPAAADPLDRLAAVGELHRSGALTDAEFTAVKARLLAR